jgi:hypothetical protein
MLTVFIGYDSREDIAYRVCRESILKHSSLPVRIIPIKQDELREDGVYLRPADPLSSTEFSFTRFLVPHLAGYKGWAVFVDCDFLFRHDIYTVMKYRDPKKALFCVKHDYKPTEETKMDGAVQHQYPRKNWSSFMLFNCEHPDTVHLRPRVVNTATGMYLHQMQWTDNENIGELPISFNYLEGWHTKSDCVDPIAVHFTRGGPWFDNWQDVEYADEWLAVKKEFEDDQSN